MPDSFEPPVPDDPMTAARRRARPALRRRFYDAVGVEKTDNGFGISLDGKPVHTPARRLLVAPTQDLARAIAAEWQAQRDVIDPAKMPLTRLANAIIDGVTEAPAPVAAEIQKYIGSDLLFYRAKTPEELRARQAKHWDPILVAAHDDFGTQFRLGDGVVHVTQPEAALKAASAAIPTDPWRLGAAHVITTLTGSALIALAMLRGRIGTDAAWQAAHVDEDWNMEQWGKDEMALQRRASRFAEFQAAADVLSSLGAA